MKERSGEKDGGLSSSKQQQKGTLVHIYIYNASVSLCFAVGTPVLVCLFVCVCACPTAATNMVPVKHGEEELLQVLFF